MIKLVDSKYLIDRYINDFDFDEIDENWSLN